MERDGRPRGRRTAVVLVVAAIALLVGGGVTVGVAVAAQQHAPQPTPEAAGTTGRPDHHHRPTVPAGTGGGSGAPGSSRDRSAHSATTTTTAPVDVGPTIPASAPVAIDIPAIGVTSDLQDLGLAPTGAIAVPQPGPHYNEAAWYDGSPTPGALGPSVIEGHIDSAATGPSVFFRLGALVPGDKADVTLADGTVAVFTVTGVRQYPKTSFPTGVVYGNTDFAALRLITCGGTFDHTTGHYLANTVVFASLTSSHPVGTPHG